MPVGDDFLAACSADLTYASHQELAQLRATSHPCRDVCIGVWGRYTWGKCAGILGDAPCKICGEAIVGCLVFQEGSVLHLACIRQGYPYWLHPFWEERSLEGKYLTMTRGMLLKVDGSVPPNWDRMWELRRARSVGDENLERS